MAPNSRNQETENGSERSAIGDSVRPETSNESASGVRTGGVGPDPGPGLDLGPGLGIATVTTTATATGPSTGMASVNTTASGMNIIMKSKETTLKGRGKRPSSQGVSKNERGLVKWVVRRFGDIRQE